MSGLVVRKVSQELKPIGFGVFEEFTGEKTIEVVEKIDKLVEKYLGSQCVFTRRLFAEMKEEVMLVWAEVQCSNDRADRGVLVLMIAGKEKVRKARKYLVGF